MNTEQKNILILKALGAELEIYYKNHTTGKELGEMVGAVMIPYRKIEKMPVHEGMKPGILVEELAFHKSAAWLEEAFNTLVFTLGLRFSVIVTEKNANCLISSLGEDGITVWSSVLKPTLKEAQFEALVIFASQILAYKETLTKSK